jgi:ABC-type microcin C transport system permease subunit YejB
MIIFFVTFILFFLEALLHYNYGKSDSDKFHLPDINELVQISITVGIFSFLNSYIIKILSRRFHLH